MFTTDQKRETKIKLPYSNDNQLPGERVDTLITKFELVS